MEDRFKQILESLPEKRQRSCLEPYTELIVELRRRGRTFREIAQILSEKCSLVVASSTVVRFVRVRSGAKRKGAKSSTIDDRLSTARVMVATRRETVIEGRECVNSDAVRQRIEALKRPQVQPQTTPKLFEYDPSLPLRITPKSERNKSDE